ncbi:uncharacterized protein LOC125494760 [Beta vulgaris subsp. vulgaris]|uniref:uncharacterized protein LOC125494760 n=1 Tax=Beta vulgaris subsp. vulgaris TaxID=3555 RepID=UPI0020371435|nr:uncharacterized protein LOC125494760 [Beta vulgaris subsp. vulgaris]
MSESLMARVLKGKYFPSRNLLEANINSNASFTWRSICSAKDVLLKGVCKVIGNGNDTCIWTDPWVPSIENSRIPHREGVMTGHEPYFVSDLFTAGSWKEDILRSHFNPWEVQAIKKIPLPMHDMVDSWMWKHTTSGLFTVKSAYYMELIEERKKKPTLSSCANRQVWQRLWSSKIQPRVKMFGWKVAHNGVLVRLNLVKKGMKLDQICPRCGEADESLEHMLMFCEGSRRVWYLSPLRLDVSTVRGGRVRDWVAFLESNKKEDECWALFWMLCWNIWVGRNAWVFEGVLRDPRVIVEKAVQGVVEVAKINDEAELRASINNTMVRWIAPSEGVYKINSDAAMFDGG